MKANKKRDADFEQFKRHLEKLHICELFRQIYSATEVCPALKIRPEDYRRWFESDVEFRVQLYLAVCSQ